MKTNYEKKVILSIKPKYVEKIFSGEKKFEYRKQIWTDRQVKKVLIYSSSPVKLVTGELTIESIISGRPEFIWNLTKEGSGIDEKDFYKYFAGYLWGYALKINDFRCYEIPVGIEKFGCVPPQSFRYYMGVE